MRRARLYTLRMPVAPHESPFLEPEMAEMDRKIRNAMGKAIREVREDARRRGIKLVVASRRDWRVPD